MLLSFLEIELSLLWTNLNSIHPRMRCAKFTWNRYCGCEGDLKILTTYFRYFVIISLWIITEFFTPVKDVMCKIWLKLANYICGSCEDKIMKFTTTTTTTEKFCSEKPSSRASLNKSLRMRLFINSRRINIFHKRFTSLSGHRRL